MEITTERRAHVCIIALRGDLDVYHAETARATFNQALNESSHLVIDLGGVEFIDSTGLALLVQALKSCHARKGAVHLSNVSPPVSTILQLTRLDRAFTMFPDTGSAARAL